MSQDKPDTEIISVTVRTKAARCGSNDQLHFHLSATHPLSSLCYRGTESLGKIGMAQFIYHVDLQDVEL